MCLSKAYDSSYTRLFFEYIKIITKNTKTVPIIIAKPFSTPLSVPSYVNALR